MIIVCLMKVTLNQHFTTQTKPFKCPQAFFLSNDNTIASTQTREV